MPVVYETESPHAARWELGPYREADYLALPDQPRFYVSRERAGILQQRVEGAPDLVVEILSPATARRDLGEKLRLYAESSIAEY